MFKFAKRLSAMGMLALVMALFCATPAVQVLPDAPVVQAEATDFLDGIQYNNEGGSLDVTVSEEGTDFNGIMNRYKNIIMAFTGILTITCFGAMILQITKLAASGDNEQARRKAIMGILTTGIGVALLGSATIVIGFFYGAISNTSGG